MGGKWRNLAEPVVTDIVRTVGMKDPKRLRIELSKAYPFGERSGYPYRAWLKEIDEQIGGMRPRKPDPGQAQLFPMTQLK